MMDDPVRLTRAANTTVHSKTQVFEICPSLG